MTLRRLVYFYLFLCCSWLFASYNEIKDKNSGTIYRIDHGQKITGHGRYIMPNETSPYFFEHELSGKENMLIAVGSFRALIDFGMGSFDYAIFLDFDQSINQFHEAHFELIDKIARTVEGAKSQRLAYLAALHNKAFDDEQFADVVVDKRKIKSFIDSLNACTITDETPFVSALKTIYQQKERNESFEKWFCDIGQSLGNYYESTYLNNAQSAYYWEDDAKWQRVVAAIQEKRIAIVAGRIDDVEHVGVINDIVNQLQTKISVFDLSNIPSAEWLHDERTARNLTKSIYSLPLAADAIILYTAQPEDGYPRRLHSVLLGEDSSWKYFLLRKEKFVYVGKIF